jgi:predicted dehydrogenase
VRALVLGCGSIGTRHARNLAGLGVEVSVFDPDLERSGAAARSTGAAALPERAGAEADILVIATPTTQHVADLEWGLARGMHVFVEKPLAATRTQLERAASLASAVGPKVVMVGCNLRFTEGFRALEANLDSVGLLLSAQVTFGWYLPEWRPGQDYRAGYSAQRSLGGGIILDAIHEIDYLLALAGPVESVVARWSNSGALAIDVEDTAVIFTKHVGGATSVTQLDYLQRSYTRSGRFIGSEATLLWDYAAHRVDLLGPAGREVIVEQADMDPNDMYLAEMRGFLEAVRDGTPTINDLPVALATTDVALRALEQGRS